MGDHPDDFPLWPAREALVATEPLPVVEAPVFMAAEWPVRPIGRRANSVPRPRPATGRRRRPSRTPRRPAFGLTALVALTLLASFFAWTSAEPFWLAVGHGVHGTATVTGCHGTGVLRRCTVSFDSGSRHLAGLTLAGPQRPVGTHLGARVVPGGHTAYVGTRDTLHFRWALGVVLLLLCGTMIAWSTGARRLETRRARTIAVILSLLTPLALYAGLLAATY